MRTHQYASGARLLRPTISRPSPPCRRHPCAMKPKARPLTSSAVPHRDAAALPSTRATGGAASMHAAYREEDECVLRHASEEELVCHCRLRPHGGGAHGGCRGRSRSRAHRARKPDADTESTFETLNGTWICNLKEHFGSVNSCELLDATWMARRASSTFEIDALFIFSARHTPNRLPPPPRPPPNRLPPPRSPTPPSV